MAHSWGNDVVGARIFCVMVRQFVPFLALFGHSVGLQVSRGRLHAVPGENRFLKIWRREVMTIQQRAGQNDVRQRLGMPGGQKPVRKLTPQYKFKR